MESAPPLASADPARHRGPALVAVATTYVALFMASVIIPMAMAGGEHFPSPFSPIDEAARYFADHASAIRVAAFLQFGSAIPLGIFAATATSRLQFLGMKVAGIHIALFGGLAASMFLGLSALIAWVLSDVSLSDTSGATHALHLLSFAAGGPGYVAAFGLLVAGIAVTAGLQRFVPRWVMIVGIAIAGLAELSSLVLVTPSVAILLPVARFSGFAWLICVGAVLPKTRGAAHLRGGRA